MKKHTFIAAPFIIDTVPDLSFLSVNMLLLIIMFVNNNVSEPTKPNQTKDSSACSKEYYECLQSETNDFKFLVSGRGLACEQQKTSNLIGF